MTAEQPVRQRIPGTQSTWLVIYWAATAVNFLLFVQGMLGIGTLPLPSVVAVTLAFAATFIGAIFATRIVRAGVQTTVFVRGTTTARVISVAWLLLGFGIVSISVISVLTAVDTTELDWTQGFAGAVGSISILAIIGPAYSEYREAVRPRSSS